MYYKVLFSVNAHTVWKRIGMVYTLLFILPYDSRGNSMWKCGNYIYIFLERKTFIMLTDKNNMGYQPLATGPSWKKAYRVGKKRKTKGLYFLFIYAFMSN